MTDLYQAMDEYAAAFPGEPMPMPFGVADEDIRDALREAVKAGRPIPRDYGWWDDLPDDAVA